MFLIIVQESQSLLNIQLRSPDNLTKAWLLLSPRSIYCFCFATIQHTMSKVERFPVPNYFCLPINIIPIQNPLFNKKRIIGIGSQMSEYSRNILIENLLFINQLKILCTPLQTPKHLRFTRISKLRGVATGHLYSTRTLKAVP